MHVGPQQSWLLALADPTGLREALPEKRLTLRSLTACCGLADRHGVLPAFLANLGQATAAHGASRIVRGVAAGLDGRLANALAPMEKRLVQRTALSMMLRQQAREAVSALLGAAVPVVVLKGADFADRLYPRAVLRPFTDVDLMIPERAASAADRVMEQLGYVPAPQSMKHAAGYGERAWRRPAHVGGTVEVHWNLVNSPSLRRAVSVAYEDLQLADDPAPTPPRVSPASLLLIAAVHGATSHGFDRLQILCDVAQAVRGAAGPLDEGYLAEAVPRTGAALAVAMALSLAEKLLGEPRCGQILSRLRLPCVPGLSRATVTPQVVLRARSRFDSIRRQALREMLKRT